MLVARILTNLTRLKSPNFLSIWQNKFLELQILRACQYSARLNADTAAVLLIEKNTVTAITTAKCLFTFCTANFY